MSEAIYNEPCHRAGLGQSLLEPLCPSFGASEISLEMNPRTTTTKKVLSTMARLHYNFTSFVPIRRRKLDEIILKLSQTDLCHWIWVLKHHAVLILLCPYLLFRQCGWVASQLVHISLNSNTEFHKFCLNICTCV